MISNYSELTSAIADYLNRQDLASVIPTFVRLAESELGRSLRVRNMLSRATATADSQYLSLPNDFLEMRNLRLSGPHGWQSLEVLSAKQVDDFRTYNYKNSAGVPGFYAINGNAIELIPVPNGQFTVEMTYYSAIPSLSDTANTNWLLAKNPDLYLFGSLLQTAPYLKEDERIQTWAGIYRSLLADVVAESERATYNGSTPKMRSKAMA